MRRLLAGLVLLCLSSSAAVAKPRHCLVRLHVQANAHDSDVFSTQMRSRFTGKPVVIEKAATITEHDVVAYYPYPADDGNYGVLLQLDDHGTLALDTLSVERRGQALFVFVNGRPITELQIDRRISDGRVYLTGGITAADLELMRRDWRLLGQRKK